MALTTNISDPFLTNVLDISKSSEDQAVSVVELVSSTASPLSPEALIEFAKQQKLLNTNLSQLRGLHRVAWFAARDTKALTAEARQEVDRLHLHLQNLYYEQRHLEGEIEACQSFHHTYTELPLIPADEFIALHPEHADSDESKLMMARIEHERTEREALEQQRQELLKRKQKLIADNKKRRDDLANLDKDLEKFIDAAKPIQKMFEKVV